MALFLQPTLSSIAARKQSLGTPMSASSRTTNARTCSPTLLLPCFGSPQNQIANNVIFTPPATTSKPLSDCGRDPRQLCIRHLVCNALPPGHVLHHYQWSSTMIDRRERKKQKCEVKEHDEEQADESVCMLLGELTFLQKGWVFSLPQSFCYAESIVR